MSSHRKFRLGIVGAGKITASAHLPAALSSPLVVVSALVDPVVERAVELAKMYGIAPVTASMLQQIQDLVDGVVIATPNQTHADIAVSCLENGIAVLIEKPLATTVADCQRVIDAARNHGRVAAVGYCTRFRDNLQLFRSLLDTQYFGPVRAFAYQFGTNGGWDTYSGYILRRENVGGGVLVVTGAHFIDRVLYLFGTPDRIAFEDDSRGGPEANARAKFFYDGAERAISGCALFSKTIALPPGLAVETEKGFLILPEHDEGLVLFRPKNDSALEMVVRGPVSRRFPAAASVFQRQLEDFVEACTTESNPMVTADEGIKSVQLIERLYASRTAMRDDWSASKHEERTLCA